MCEDFCTASKRFGRSPRFSADCKGQYPDARLANVAASRPACNVPRSSIALGVSVTIAVLCKFQYEMEPGLRSTKGTKCLVLRSPERLVTGTPSSLRSLITSAPKRLATYIAAASACSASSRLGKRSGVCSMSVSSSCRSFVASSLCGPNILRESSPIPI